MVAHYSRKPGSLTEVLSEDRVNLLESAEGRTKKSRTLNWFLHNHWPIPCLLLFALALLTIEFHAGRNFRLTILYVLPVALSAWSRHKRIAYVLAILLPGCRLLFFAHWDAMDDLYYGMFNASLRMAVLVIVAHITVLARLTVELKKRVVELEMQTLRKTIADLENIIPMCASCRRIRESDGTYESLETYLSKHSETKFSHGICPDCMDKYDLDE